MTNIREKAKTYLHQELYFDFDEIIEDYDLQDEKREFLDGAPERIQMNYRNHEYRESMIRKAADEIMSGYDDYYDEIREFAYYSNIRGIDAEDYFEIAADRLGLSEAQLKGEEEI